jgi:hypothetical protein
MVFGPFETTLFFYLILQVVFPQPVISSGISLLGLRLRLRWASSPSSTYIFIDWDIGVGIGIGIGIDVEVALLKNLERYT